MLLIDNRDVRDPALNLALDEYCVRNLDPTPGYLLLYVNRPSIILGKNQNPLLEVNPEFVRRHRIPVLRRISGGGTVYHDHGNLNFGFVVPFRIGSPVRFADLVRPVVRGLVDLGVPARLNERNDILVGDRKVSGNAQFTTVRSMIGHGTLLFDADLDAVSDALRVPAERIRSNAVRSTPSPVTNIREHLPAPMTMDEFRRRLVEALLGGAEPTKTLELTEAQWAEVRRLADRRYRSWSWSFGRTPPFEIRRAGRVADEDLEVRVAVREGAIESIRIERRLGDRRVRLEGIEGKLLGSRYSRKAVRAALTGPDPGAAVDGLAVPGLVDLVGGYPEPPADAPADQPATT